MTLTADLIFFIMPTMKRLLILIDTNNQHVFTGAGVGRPAYAV